MPNIENMARLTQTHYKIDGKGGKKKIVKKADKLGYSVESMNRGVIHYKNRADGHNVISVKGTDLSNMDDLFSDAKLGLGISSNDKQFRQRRNEIKEIYRKTEGDNYITAHSLGSSIALSSLVKNKSIIDKTKKAYLYNTGYTGLFHNELSQDLKREDKKILKDKVIHVHREGDIVSTSLTDKSIGDVKIIKGDKNDGLLEKHSLTNFTGEED